MRYTFFAGLILGGALATAPRLSAQGGEFPSGIRGRQASQVVGQMLDLRAELLLTDAQVRQLSALQASFRAERSRFRPGPKTWHAGGRPVTSNTTAYRQAAAILTPVQRAAAFRLLDQVPIRASAAATSDPLVHHAAGIEAPPARQGRGEPLDPLLHDTGKAPAEQPETGSKVMTNPSDSPGVASDRRRSRNREPGASSPGRVRPR